MITGGNSLIMGFQERLNHDLALKCPTVGTQEWQRLGRFGWDALTLPVTLP